MANSRRKAFFFDRDGIVNKRILCGYVTCIEEFEFLPDFFPFFQAVKQAGYLAIMITNQQGIGKGLMSDDDLAAIHGAMQEELLRRTGCVFDDIFYCGDLASQAHNRRKPSPFMLLEAIEKWNIEADQSWIIGDSISDAAAANAAGVPSLLIGNFQLDSSLNLRYVFPALHHALGHLDQILA